MNKKYLGVYSTVEAGNQTVSNSGQLAQAPLKRYWYAWEWDTGTVLVQSANENMEPTGQPKILVYAVFDSRFSYNELKSLNLPEPPLPAADNTESPKTQAASTPEADQFTQTVANKDISPVFRDLSGTQPPKAELISGSPQKQPPPAPRTDEEPASADKAAEPERNYYSLEELGLAEQDASAAFWGGYDLYTSGKQEEALRDFERPLLINAPWQRKHKHLFSDFGITLRKIKISRLALRYHNKALSLSPGEPNILFNLARVHLSLGDLNSARTCVLSVLAKKPDLKEALLLKDYIDKNR